LAFYPAAAFPIRGDNDPPIPALIPDAIGRALRYRLCHRFATRKRGDCGAMSGAEGRAGVRNGEGQKLAMLRMGRILTLHP
jgi:hypothetical protein